jgi:hypothetical protein
MQKQARCANGMCECSVQDGKLFCSDYCAQAVAQGIERNYCQCEHEHVAPMFTPDYVLKFSTELPEVAARDLHAVR